MSLGQYLALTRSVKNVSGEGRYKVADTPLAPDFSRHGAGTRTTSETGGESALVTVALVEPPSQPKTEVKPAPIQPQALPAPRPRRSPVAGKDRWGWLLGQNRRRNPGMEMAVQRELALGLVKPVCNDLSESDLEAVPMASPAPVPAAESGPGAAPGVWRRWSAGLCQGIRRCLPWPRRG